MIHWVGFAAYTGRTDCGKSVAAPMPVMASVRESVVIILREWIPEKKLDTLFIWGEYMEVMMNRGLISHEIWMNTPGSMQYGKSRNK